MELAAGVLILAALFVGLFVAGCVLSGWRTTLFAVVSALGISGLVLAGVLLITIGATKL